MQSQSLNPIHGAQAISQKQGWPLVFALLRPQGLRLFVSQCLTVLAALSVLWFYVLLARCGFVLVAMIFQPDTALQSAQLWQLWPWLLCAI
ncbi:hypothetical protein VST7929_00647 [Vibrio stylophorae]|uniref:Uncharacterized protein n=1 Tax=Vibrio stylophorae TaxID=659351 RepID=A0ABN8DS76_9VIBR|nr:hypothetical protein [Vibrio stylophorae]CAH0532800.1 hypothetical protein VST7929_00647 [Vibrio stylophorae]